MNIAEAKQHVKNTVQAYLAKDEAGMYRVALPSQRPLFLLGAPGIGKTAIMSQIANELGIGLVSYSMTHHTRQSALGLPFIVHREYRDKSFDMSEYTMSEIIGSIYEYMDVTGYESGILFLDEINCVSETLYPSMLQFLQFKTFGRHKVPDNWIVVCAGNPPGYNRSVHDFDIVTLDRLRKIEIEPDFGAWQDYARQTGVHPAVMSFLEIKRENFYSVESTPSGKRFVSARGWTDLAEIITLFEDQGTPIDLGLIAQYVQDPEIAEQFALYYDLFNKYRSDYQVGSILAGEATEEIVGRARKAAFDERLALMSLLMDALEAPMGDTLELEEVLLDVRDVLREVKPRLLEGASVEDTLVACVSKRERSLERRIAAETGMAEYVRHERLVLGMLKGLAGACELERIARGKEAFDLIQTEYAQEVAKLDPAIEKTSKMLDNGFDFIEQAFGNDREMLVFVTELTARRNPSRFINRFGSESYYQHNQDLMVDQHREELLARIKDLGYDLGDDASVQTDKAVNSMTASTTQDPERSGADEAGYSTLELMEYYDKIPGEFGFASKCKMVVPGGLEGKRVLDVGCRRGKGVYKFSEMVGQNGRAIGVDSTKHYIDEAASNIEFALRRNGLRESNMEFAVGYPENLRVAGIDDASVDVVFINSLINLTKDMPLALSEMHRVLAHGGLLVIDGVVAEGQRDKKAIEGAIALGNSIQAAPYRADLERMLSEAGFEKPEYSEEYELDPSEGYESGYLVETADTDEKVVFTKTTIHTIKR